MPRALPVKLPLKPSTRRKWVHQFKEPLRQDPYRSENKPLGNARCTRCRSVNVHGDWISAAEAGQKDPPVKISEKTLCPACRQARDHYAMGVVEIHGSAWRKSRAAVLRNIEKTEEILRARNDQERILWTEDTRAGTFKIYVTLQELARQIARELERSFKGIAEYRHSTEEPFLRVYWWSDAPHVGHEPGSPIDIKRRSRVARNLGRRGKAIRSSASRGRGGRQKVKS